MTYCLNLLYCCATIDNSVYSNSKTKIMSNLMVTSLTARDIKKLHDLFTEFRSEMSEEISAQEDSFDSEKLRQFLDSVDRTAFLVELDALLERSNKPMFRYTLISLEDFHLINKLLNESLKNLSIFSVELTLLDAKELSKRITQVNKCGISSVRDDTFFNFAELELLQKSEDFVPFKRDLGKFLKSFNGERISKDFAISLDDYLNLKEWVPRIVSQQDIS